MTPPEHRILVFAHLFLLSRPTHVEWVDEFSVLSLSLPNSQRDIWGSITGWRVALYTTPSRRYTPWKLDSFIVLEYPLGRRTWTSHFIKVRMRRWSEGNEEIKHRKESLRNNMSLIQAMVEILALWQSPWDAFYLWVIAENTKISGVSDFSYGSMPNTDIILSRGSCPQYTWRLWIVTLPLSKIVPRFVIIFSDIKRCATKKLMLLFSSQIHQILLSSMIMSCYPNFWKHQCSRWGTDILILITG